MPALTDIRLNELRFVTDQYILDLPTLLTLKPTVTTPTAVQAPSGGFNYGQTGPISRPPQYFRVSANASPSGPERSRLDAGQSIQYGYTLTGQWNAEIEEGDVWDETAPDGSPIHYCIKTIEPRNGWETKAIAYAYATDPQHGG